MAILRPLFKGVASGLKVVPKRLGGVDLASKKSAQEMRSIKLLRQKAGWADLNQKDLLREVRTHGQVKNGSHIPQSRGASLTQTNGFQSRKYGAYRTEIGGFGVLILLGLANEDTFCLMTRVAVVLMRSRGTAPLPMFVAGTAGRWRRHLWRNVAVLLRMAVMQTASQNCVEQHHCDQQIGHH